MRGPGSCRFAAVVLSFALTVAGVARGQPFDDCDNNGIPDDVFGQGRLFSDTFRRSLLDAARWPVVSGATADDVGLNEPTPPYALRLNGAPFGGDAVESVAIDLSGASAAVLTYRWQRGGGGEPPDVGDDLFVEFLTASGMWILLAQHPGGGPAMTTFEQASIALPPAAYHAGFVLRLRNMGTPGSFDDWFVDDVFLTDGVPDCNANGVPDACDVDEGTSPDCNSNGIPDECDVAELISLDCNENAVPDECDIAQGTSSDVNGDYVPDECQDCNNNGVLDPEDIASGASRDCNLNGVPDECDLAAGVSGDCNGNGTPDECEFGLRTYQVDDGNHESWIGAAGGGGFIWLNRFNVEPGSEEIDAISLAWGRVPIGMLTTLAIWSDPDNDGDPTNAVLLLTAGPVPVSNPMTDIFTLVEVPRTRVGQPGDAFFVGAYVVHSNRQYPGSLDLDSPSQQSSWFAIGNNLSDLSANPTPPQLVDSQGWPGNWLLRCRSADNNCNANELPDDCDLESGLSHDNNLSGIPDECELGSDAALTLVPDAPCYGAGDTMTVAVWMNATAQTVVAGQFRLIYDPAQLELVSVDPGGPPSPFTFEIYECSPVTGETPPQCNPTPGVIDYAVGVWPGTPGVAGEARLALLTFLVLQPLCDAPHLLRWGTDGLPVRLGTVETTSVAPLLVDLGVSDHAAPVLVAPPDISAAAEGGACAAEVDPGLPTATDNCTGPQDIVITWSRSDGHQSLADPYGVADAPITITWWAADECGNSSTGTTRVDVYLRGDLDVDRDVDLTDLATLLSNYGLTSGAGYAEGDLDGDGDVDLTDLALLLAAYGADCN